MSTQEVVEINVSKRSTGKATCRGLRSSRVIPANVYGPKMDNAIFSLHENDAVKYSGQKFDNALFSLKSDDSKLNGVRVLMKDVVRHPVKQIPTHIDFYAPDLTKTVKVAVELRYEGKPVGLQDGGVFNALKRDIEIECLPSDIPEFIQVDVSDLAINQTFHVSDVKLPPSLKLMTSEADAIATVIVVKEEVAAPVEEAPAAEGDAPAADAGAEKKD